MNFSESQSMILYFGTWFLLILFINIAEYLQHQKSIVLNYGNVRWNTDVFKRNMLYACIPTGMYIIFSGRGISVGTDTYNYYRKYQTIDGSGLFDNEPLFYLLNKVCSDLGLTFGQFQFVVCLITSFLVIKAIYFYLENNKKYIYLAVTLYYFIYFFLSMNITRQLIAVAIIFYSAKYLVSKQYVRYFFACIIATGVHSSAIVSILFFISPLLEYSNDKMRRYWYYVILLVIIILSAPIMSFISKVFSFDYAVSSTFRFGFLVDYLVPLVLIVLYELHILTWEKDDEVFRIIKNVFLLSLPLRTLGYGAIAMMRVAHFSAIFQIVLIPMLLLRVKGKFIRIFSIFAVILIYVFLFVTNYLNVNGIFPYSTWKM